MNVMELIICLVGNICSGKSTIAKSLSEKLSLPRSSFGGYLVYYSQSHNLPTNRQDLQNLGESFIRDNALEFLDNTIEFGRAGSNKMILDGVRHFIILNRIKEICDNAVFIYVEANSDVRYRRYIKRENLVDSEKNFADFLIADSHSVEQETEKIKAFCDLIVDSENTSQEVIEADIIGLIQ